MKLIVVACNAATSAALPALQEALAVPVVGVITPEAARRRPRDAQPAHRAARDAGDRDRGPLRGARSTRSTRASAFTAVACPKLVPLIEAGEQTVDAVREYAAPLQAAGCDTVILGCTHYPLIRPVLQRVFGRDVTLVFSAEETAREVAETLARKGWENEREPRGRVSLPHHRRPGALPRLGERFLQLPLGEVRRVTVAELERAAA